MRYISAANLTLPRGNPKLTLRVMIWLAMLSEIRNSLGELDETRR
jgi:hypothetical protein